MRLSLFMVPPVFANISMINPILARLEQERIKYMKMITRKITIATAIR